jgi:hypothetical protein
MNEKKNPPFILILTVILAGVGLFLYTRQRFQQSINAVEAEKEAAFFLPDRSRAPAQASTDRTKAIRKLMHKDPQLALEKTRAVLERPTSRGEATFAKEQLPNILNVCFSEALKADDREGAQVYMTELTTDHPDHFQTRATLNKWGQDIANRLRDAIPKEDDPTIDEMLTELRDGDYLITQGWVLKQYHEYQVKKWQEAREAGADENETEDRLMKAASVMFSVYPNSEMIRALERDKEVLGTDLRKEGERLIRDGEQVEGIAFLQAAMLKAGNRLESYFGTKEGRDWGDLQKVRTELEAQVINELCKIGQDLEEDSKSHMVSVKMEDLYHETSRIGQDRALRIKPLELKLACELKQIQPALEAIKMQNPVDLASDDYLTYEEKNAFYSLAHDLRGKISNIKKRTGSALFQAMLADDSYTPWPFIPTAISTEIELKHPEPNDEKRRRDELASRVRQQPELNPIPQVREAQQELYEVLGRWGILYFDGNPQEGFRMLRSALRGSENEQLRSDIIVGLQTLFVSAFNKKDFDALYELSGFYISEAEFNQADDEFQAFFKKAITQAAEEFKERAPMRHTFMLSILGTAFPDDPDGEKAITEATKLAFEQVASQSQEAKPPESGVTSGLEKHSVIAIDNSTEYHLLCFYRGPEEFFVNATPYRRGTVIMQDGEYDVAVITPSGEIVPYHGSLTVDSSLVRSNYYIGSSDASNQWGVSSSAHGEYRLMRVSDDIDVPEIDPKTGVIK